MSARDGSCGATSRARIACIAALLAVATVSNAQPVRPDAAPEPPHAAAAAPDRADAPAAPEPADAAAKKPPHVSALIRAAGISDAAKLRQLLKNGAPVNGRGDRGETPLQAAATEGLSTNVFVLLSAGADVNMVGSRGITALGWAARGGHVQTVRMLLDTGASPDAAASPDRAPLPLAVAREHFAVVALLIERGSRVFEHPPLANAAILALSQTSSVELVGLLVPRFVPMFESGKLRGSAAAAIAGSSAVVGQAILSRLGDPARTREFQTSLLLAAVRRGRHDVASGAIAAGADVNTREGGKSPLALAVAANDSNMLTLLLGANAEVAGSGIDDEKLKDVMGSQGSDRLEVERVIASGQLDQRNPAGETLLFRAAQRGNFVVAKMLLSRGADPAATVSRWPGDEGWTPLMIASAGGQIPLVKLLLESNAAVDQRNGHGRTALHFASLYGRAPVVDMLINAGADPRLMDDAGQSAFRLAAASGESSTITRIQHALRALQDGAAPAGASSPGNAARVAPAAGAAAGGTRAPGAASAPGARP